LTLEADPQPVAGGLRDALQGAGGRLDAAAFEAGDHSLLGMHALRQLLLRQAGARAGGYQRRGEAEFLLEALVGLLVLGVFEPSSMQFVGGNQLLAHLTSSARLRESSISRRGVFWVFFTNTRTTTTRCNGRVT